MKVWHNILKTLAAIIACWCAVTLSAQAQTGSDTKSGSVLFYNIYTSNPINPVASDTLITITNTSPNKDIDVHLYFVDGLTCRVADAFITLTRNQTAGFRVSDMDPGVQGYIMAVAVDRQGVPTQHNYLIGYLRVKQMLGPGANSTHSYQLNAISFSKINNLLPALSPDGITAQMVFDGAATGSSYEQLPAGVAINSFESPATADTRFIIYSPKSDFYGPSDSSGRLFIVFYDDAENPYSASVGLVCWLQARLTIIRNLTVRIAAGRTGWARFLGLRDNNPIPLLGSVAQASGFTGGHNMHHLSTLPTYTITVPVFPPN